MGAGLGATVLASSPCHYETQPEYLLLRIFAPGCHSLGVYRLSKVGYLMSFRADFERLLATFFVTVLIGDFNIDLNCLTHDSKSLFDLCTSNCLYLVLFKDTYYTFYFHTRIDHCLIRKRALLASYYQCPLSFSMHDLIEVTLDFNVYRRPPRCCITRNFSHFDLQSFQRLLSALDWSDFARLTVDAKLDFLNKSLLFTLDLHVPRIHSAPSAQRGRLLPGLIK